MDHVYHLKPENMHGNVLFPLSELSKQYPDLGKEYIKNYKGREEVILTKIELLSCSWQDVLFLSALNPILIFQALDVLNLLDEDIPDILQFPISSLKKKEFCLFKEIDGKDHFAPCDISSYEEPKNLSKGTWSYFLDCVSSGEKPLIFADVSHILVKGTLDIRDAKTIKYHPIIRV